MHTAMIRILLVLALTAVLAACGGGGTDGGAGSGVTPPPANAAPSISGSPASSIRVGENYSFVPTASDPDGDALTFSIENAPMWAVFDSSTGELSGSPTASNIGTVEAVSISVSDGDLSASLSPFSIVVMPETLGRANFAPMGDVIPIPDGYQSVGDLVVATNEFQQEFKNASLTLIFDENDELDLLNGETDLPLQLSDNVVVNGTVRAVVETLTGREINEDTDFGIRLMEDTKYFVFYIGTAFDITITDRSDPTQQETLTLGTPATGEILMITDPTDTFLYEYSSTPLVGSRGTGSSDNGLIPFQPVLDFAPLDSFTGHQLENGSIGLGFKYVDFFEVSGTGVFKNSTYADINFDDVFESDFEYRGGLNGDLDFAMSILGFGLFSFDLAQVSATLDVGLDRQQLAMALEIAPDQALFPPAYNVGPLSAVTGSGYLDGDGDYGIFLEGLWASTLPEASIGGLLSVENEVVGMTGTVDEGGQALSVSLEFANDQTVGRVEFPGSFSASINDTVSAALDRRIAEVEQLIEDLEQATRDYEFEVSLRGLRESLPAMMDAAITTLNAIPGSARSDARNSALSYMRNTCISVLVGSVCLDDVADENAIADNAGDEAFRRAAAAIVSPRAAMTELKLRAEEADDEALREALKAALDAAYANRTVSISASYAHTFGAPINRRHTVYSRSWTETVLSPSNAAAINTASQNVYRIQETSDIVISTQEILDRMPSTEAIESVKAEVDSATADIPAVDGLGYIASNDQYMAFVTIDGEDWETGINVLRPSDVQDGVSDLLADILLDDPDNH